MLKSSFKNDLGTPRKIDKFCRKKWALAGNILLLAGKMWHSKDNLLYLKENLGTHRKISRSYRKISLDRKHLLHRSEENVYSYIGQGCMTRDINFFATEERKELYRRARILLYRRFISSREDGYKISPSSYIWAAFLQKSKWLEYLFTALNLGKTKAILDRYRNC